MKLASSAVGAQDHRALVLTLLTLCNLTLAPTHANPNRRQLRSSKKSASTDWSESKCEECTRVLKCTGFRSTCITRPE